MTPRWPRLIPPGPAPGPLLGCSLIWTRPGAESGELAPEALAALGAEVLEAPAIEFASFVERNLEQCRRVLELLREREGWLILPSPTAIRYFGEVLNRFHLDTSVFDDIYVAVIGKGSAAELARIGLSPDFVPPGSRGQTLAETLPAEPGTPVIIAGSSQTRAELRDGLAARGLSVQVLPLYAPRACRPGLRAIHAALAERPGRFVLVTSPSGVDAILKELPPEESLTSSARWVAIGPTTHRRLLDCGIRPDRAALASAPTLDGLSQAILSLISDKSNKSDAAAEGTP